jgi:hypothetical protein
VSFISQEKWDYKVLVGELKVWDLNTPRHWAAMTFIRIISELDNPPTNNQGKFISEKDIKHCNKAE